MDLLIEIVSPGDANRRRDFSAKRQLYGKYGVEEYWIVDKENLSVSIFRLEGRILKEVTTLTNDDELTSAVLPNFQLPLRAIFKL